jgi:hypothetical protein
MFGQLTDLLFLGHVDSDMAGLAARLFNLLHGGLPCLVIAVRDNDMEAPLERLRVMKRVHDRQRVEPLVAMENEQRLQSLVAMENEQRLRSLVAMENEQRLRSPEDRAGSRARCPHRE